MKPPNFAMKFFVPISQTAQASLCRRVGCSSILRLYLCLESSTFEETRSCSQINKDTL